MRPMSAGPTPPGDPLPQPLRRAGEGRWLGGVCRGMANRWSMPVGQLRALFAVATLLGGLGLLAYAACWLVLPTDAEEESPSLLRGLASVALLGAALAGLGTIALLAGLATLFGFGWAVAVAVGAFLLGALAFVPAARPGWVLLPLLAAALPAVAVAVSGTEVAAQAGLRSERPERVEQIPRDGYETGLGDLFVDLRRLRAAAGETIPLTLDTGIGQTVVALPRDRCFNVELRYATDGGVGLRMLRALRSFGEGFTFDPNEGGGGAVNLFGDWQSGDGAWSTVDVDRRAPTLRIDYRSLGGELYLRDYPRDVNPLDMPWWPYGGNLSDPRELRRLSRGPCERAARAADRRTGPRVTAPARAQPRAGAERRRPTARREDGR